MHYHNLFHMETLINPNKIKYIVERSPRNNKEGRISMGEERWSEKIYQELRRISRLLTIGNASIIEAELNKITNTDARKKMWVLMDGIKMPKDLAATSGVSTMAVSNYLSAALALNLIEYAPRQPPQRALDYIPPTWLSLVELPKVQETEQIETQQGSEEKKTEGEINGSSAV